MSNERGECPRCIDCDRRRKPADFFSHGRCPSCWEEWVRRATATLVKGDATKTESMTLGKRAVEPMICLMQQSHEAVGKLVKDVRSGKRQAVDILEIASFVGSVQECAKRIAEITQAELDGLPDLIKEGAPGLDGQVLALLGVTLGLREKVGRAHVDTVLKLTAELYLEDEKKGEADVGNP